jgi:hypothetical protein
MATETKSSGEPVARATYTIEECAKLLGVGRNQCYEAAGKTFPVIKIGARYVVPKIAFDRLLAEGKI